MISIKDSAIKKLSCRILVAAVLLVQVVSAAPCLAAEPPPETTTTQTAEPATPSTSAAQLKNIDDGSISLDYFKGYFTHTGRLLTSPLGWDSGNWLKAGAVAGITGGLYLLDANIRDLAKRNQNKVADKFATVGNDLGVATYTLPPIGAFYLYGYLTDNVKAKQTSLLAVESLMITGMFTQGIKMLAQRERPNSGASPDQWQGPKFSLKNESFCSGHTSSAFSIATVFAEKYSDSAFVPPVAYGLASLTGLARIYGNKHWASDVFFGAALGYFVGKSVVKYHNDDVAKKLSIMPTFDGGYKGLALSYKF